MWWFYGTITSSIRGGFVRYFSQYMEQLPIPSATAAQKAPITECVRKIIAAPDNPTVLRLEDEINRLIYAHYKLTTEEVKIIETDK